MGTIKNVAKLPNCGSKTKLRCSIGVAHNSRKHLKTNIWRSANQNSKAALKTKGKLSEKRDKKLHIQEGAFWKAEETGAKTPDGFCSPGWVYNINLEIFKLSNTFKQKKGSWITLAHKRSLSIYSNWSKLFAVWYYELLYQFCSHSFLCCFFYLQTHSVLQLFS